MLYFIRCCNCNYSAIHSTLSININKRRSQIDCLIISLSVIARYVFPQDSLSLSLSDNQSLIILEKRFLRVKLRIRLGG